MEGADLLTAGVKVVSSRRGGGGAVSREAGHRRGVGICWRNRHRSVGWIYQRR